jgi:hypothetical protein
MMLFPQKTHTHQDALAELAEECDEGTGGCRFPLALRLGGAVPRDALDGVSASLRLFVFSTPHRHD